MDHWYAVQQKLGYAFWYEIFGGGGGEHSQQTSPQQVPLVFFSPASAPGVKQPFRKRQGAPGRRSRESSSWELVAFWGPEKVGQNLWCLFGDGYHSTVVFFLEGFLGVHRNTRVLTHRHPRKRWHMFSDSFGMGQNSARGP